MRRLEYESAALRSARARKGDTFSRCDEFGLILLFHQQYGTVCVVDDVVAYAAK
jgi:hypothetical protein